MARLCCPLRPALALVLLAVPVVGQASTCPNSELEVVIAGRTAPDGTALSFLGQDFIEVAEDGDQVKLTARIAFFCGDIPSPEVIEFRVFRHAAGVEPVPCEPISHSHIRRQAGMYDFTELSWAFAKPSADCQACGCSGEYLLLVSREVSASASSAVHVQEQYQGLFASAQPALEAIYFFKGTTFPGDRGRTPSASVKHLVGPYPEEGPDSLTSSTCVRQDVLAVVQRIEAWASL